MSTARPVDRNSNLCSAWAMRGTGVHHQPEEPMDRKPPLPPPNEGTPNDATKRNANPTEKERSDKIEPNPPHTTTGKITSPKFGSAGSGGAEFEPGPKRP